jgi:hypothetical protein
VARLYRVARENLHKLALTYIDALNASDPKG